MKKLSKVFSTAVYLFTGCINGLLGSGGGMIAVPFFRKAGLSQKQAQANAVAVILPISVVSIISFAVSGNFPVAQTMPYALTGLLGGILGTMLLNKLSNRFLSVVFSIFMLYAGVRLLFK